MNILPIILSGGSGSRLWPLSREQYPKQLLPLASKQTLLQQTVSRVTQWNDIKIVDPVIVCNEQHRFLVAEQLREIDAQASRIILEPVGRNTAPALTLAALSTQNNANHGSGQQPGKPPNQGMASDVVMLVMPADHIIKDNAQFKQAVQIGFEYAQKDALVTFGVVPTGPETGYGYIKLGDNLGENIPDKRHSQLLPSVLDRFVEKPDAETALQYVESEQYLWNSGMFLIKASTWLAAVSEFNPEMRKQCQSAYECGTEDLDFFRVDNKMFSNCPSDSIDYAVMEKLGNAANIKESSFEGVVIPLDSGWSDIGAWSALWEVGDQDSQGNVLDGDVLLHNVHNSLIKSDHRLVAAVGLNDLIVIETADAVLIANKNSAQDVKKIVDLLKAQDREERVYHRQVYRPWGSYEGVTAGDRFQVKQIVVNPGASLSLQMHHHRAEHWVVVRGTARVTRGDDTFLLSENESTYIPLGTTHRLENPGTLPLEIIEVQSGSYLGEDDIVRFEDIYGRIDNANGDKNSGSNDNGRLGNK